MNMRSIVLPTLAATAFMALPFLVGAGSLHQAMNPYGDKELHHAMNPYPMHRYQVPARTTASIEGNVRGGMSVPYRDPTHAAYNGEAAGQVLPHQLVSYQEADLVYNANVPRGSNWGAGNGAQRATASDGRGATAVYGGEYFSASGAGTNLVTDIGITNYSDALVRSDLVSAFAKGGVVADVTLNNGTISFAAGTKAGSAAIRR